MDETEPNDTDEKEGDTTQESIRNIAEGLVELNNKIESALADISKNTDEIQETKTAILSFNKLKEDISKISKVAGMIEVDDDTKKVKYFEDGERAEYKKDGTVVMIKKCN